jgi:predicted metal-binding membrane protein
MATSVAVRPRDRLAILTGLAGVTAAAWVYVLVYARHMTGGSMSDAMHSLSRVRPWTMTEFGLRLVMWVAMMVAMMVPTALPVTLIYAGVARKAEKLDSPVSPTFVFVGGYVAMWGLFAVAATAAQRGLEALALLSPQMVSKSPVLGGALLIAAGIYQLTPLKQACLKSCRSPAHFIAQHWRKGTFGALRMGAEHGAYCLGCCWVVMGLLFVGGVMNLLWIAAIAVFVLLEKVAPFGEVGGRLLGAGALVAGALVLVS